MNKKRSILITKPDRIRLQDLLQSSVAEALRDKPYLADLQGELDIAQTVQPDQIPADVVTMDSMVRLTDVTNGETETFTLVYPDEADIAEGKLSILAPLGTAILGYRVGDLIRWRVPSGIAKWRIEELVFQPERDGVLV